MARMSLVDILWLYRARLRARAVLVQECFAILGIAIGVALLFASQVASTSLTRSVSQLTSQLVGNTQFQLDAQRPRRLQTNGCWARCGACPGVTDRAAGARAAGERDRAHGRAAVGRPDRHRSRASRTSPGRCCGASPPTQLAAQQAIALPAPLAEEIGAGPLETIKLQIGASVVQTLLGATLGEADIGGLVHSPVALAPVGYAQTPVRDEGRITRIFVQARRRAGARSASGVAAAGRDRAGQRRAEQLRLDAVRSGSGPREPERDVVLRDQRVGGLHVRAERDAGHGALAAQADRGHHARRARPA